MVSDLAVSVRMFRVHDAEFSFGILGSRVCGIRSIRSGVWGLGERVSYVSKVLWEIAAETGNIQSGLQPCNASLELFPQP